MIQELTQSEISRLLNMDKEYLESKVFDYPYQGEKISIPLFSKDKKEKFALDINRASIDISKVTFLNRARNTIVLLRLDLGGRPHRNPDGEEIPVPHLHIYRKGYGDKFAYALPAEFQDCSAPAEYLEKFMDYCHIVKKPAIERGLFT